MRIKWMGKSYCKCKRLYETFPLSLRKPIPVKKPYVFIRIPLIPGIFFVTKRQAMCPATATRAAFIEKQRPQKPPGNVTQHTAA